MRSPRSRSWRRLVRCAPLPVVVLALAACGGSGATSGAGSRTGGVAGTTTKVGGGQRVVASESEYKIQLSTMSLKPGPTTFVAKNDGQVAHSLEIDGPGVSDKRIVGTLGPGSSKTLTVTLRDGSYEIYCPVDGHKQLGMDVHVTVGQATSGAPTSTDKTSTNGSTSGGGGGY